MPRRVGNARPDTQYAMVSPRDLRDAASAAAAGTRTSEPKPRSGSSDPPDATNSASGDQLPPRIVVEQPDGGVILGEDDARLEGERHAFETDLAASQGQAAQPGTERWLDLRRLLYATALDTLVLTRKRHAAVLLSAPLHPLHPS